MENSHRAVSFSARLHKKHIIFLELFIFPFASAESLGCSNSRDAAFYRSVYHSRGHSSFFESRAHLLSAIGRNSYKYRHAGKNNKREINIYRAKVDKRAYHSKRGNYDVFGAVVSKLRYIEKIVGYS